jgi:hypothetical protein
MRLAAGILLGIGLCALTAVVCGVVAIANVIKSLFR